MFEWLGNGRFHITKIGQRKVKSKKRSIVYYGCGKSVNCKEMATVELPSEFSEAVKVSTSDVKTLPPTVVYFRLELSGKIDAARRKLKLGEAPPHDSNGLSWASLNTFSSSTASDSKPTGTT